MTAIVAEHHRADGTLAGITVACHGDCGRAIYVGLRRTYPDGTVEQVDPASVRMRCIVCGPFDTGDALPTVTLTADQLLEMAAEAIYENGLPAFFDLADLGEDDDGCEVGFIDEHVLTQPTAAHYLAHHLATHPADWVYYNREHWGFADDPRSDRKWVDAAYGIPVDDPTAPLPAIPTVTKLLAE